jgi:internalin A
MHVPAGHIVTSETVCCLNTVLEVACLTTEIPSPGRKPRRWLRFSLATFLGVVTVVCLWLGWQSYVARHQKTTVELIQAVGGTVSYEQVVVKARERAALKRSSKGAPLPEEDPTPRERAEAAVGRDFFDSPIAVRFAANYGRRPGSDEPQVTPQLLARLASLTRLEIIDLSFNESVTDDSLAHLRDLTNLKTLYFYNGVIRGPGLVHLTGLPQLNYLELSYTPLDDEGLKHIAEMKSLTGLLIGFTRISDAGVAHLESLQSLDRISLRSTAVTDECFKHLAKLPKLKGVYLQHTGVTAEGVAKFRQQFPKCRLMTSFSLGKTPVDVDWQFEDAEPSAARLTARMNELGFPGIARAHPQTPDGPIISVHLGMTAVSDASLLQLVNKLPSLNDLKITNAVVGDEFLRGLAGNANLGVLSLSDTRITDDGLQYLADLPALRYLVLSEEAITDEGLKQLAQLKELKGVILRESNCTAVGVRALQKALPDCEITY